MIVKEKHYYRFTNGYGVEYIFQAMKREDKGWIIDVVRSSSKYWGERKAGFYVTTSDNTSPNRDNLKELTDAEILAIKI